MNKLDHIPLTWASEDIPDLPTIQVADEVGRELNLPFEPQEVTQKIAESDDYFVSRMPMYRRLLVEDLVDKAICIWSPIGILPAIPVGEVRRSGAMDYCCKNFERFAMKILKDYNGFPDLRVDKLLNGAPLLCWGEEIPWDASHTETGHAGVGRLFGYKEDQIAEFARNS